MHVYAFGAWLSVLVDLYVLRVCVRACTTAAANAVSCSFTAYGLFQPAHVPIHAHTAGEFKSCCTRARTRTHTMQRRTFTLYRGQVRKSSIGCVHSFLSLLVFPRGKLVHLLQEYLSPRLHAHPAITAAVSTLVHTGINTSDVLSVCAHLGARRNSLMLCM